MTSAITSPERFMSAVYRTPGWRERLGRRAPSVKLTHAVARFLLRIRLELFLHRGDADCAACEGCRRHCALAPIPARSDLQGARLGHLAVQSLSRQRPLHGARLRASGRCTWVDIPPAGSVSAKH